MKLISKVLWIIRSTILEIAAVWGFFLIVGSMWLVIFESHNNYRRPRGFRFPVPSEETSAVVFEKLLDSPC
ncbi:MAG: hypothetical protein MK384_09705, partial [SAR202 cluster bacterium]|nr:hypothetical protein [SAR202 cluster bacterium]